MKISLRTIHFKKAKSLLLNEDPLIKTLRRTNNSYLHRRKVQEPKGWHNPIPSKENFTTNFLRLIGVLPFSR